MPGLLTLTTNLKSLKYGSDTPGGGNSNQPYIVTDINDPNLGPSFDGGFIRGGTVGAVKASAIDTARIGKFIADGSKGALFISKQVALQQSNPRLEIPKNPLNIAQGGIDNVLAVGTNGLLEPTRIYNLGINTLAQIPVNAFGVHFNRHGTLPVQNEASKYEAVVKANNDNIFEGSGNNRLVLLKDKFELGSKKVDDIFISNALNRVNGLIGLIGNVSSLVGGPQIPSLTVSPQQQIIDQYFGGPNSVYGLGNTTIRRYSYTEDGGKIQLAFEQSNQFAGKTRDDKGNPQPLNYSNALGLSKQLVSDGYIPPIDPIDFNLLSLPTYAKNQAGTYYYTSKEDGSLNLTEGNLETRAERSLVPSYKRYKEIIESRNLTEQSIIIDGERANEFSIYTTKNENEEYIPTSTNRPNYSNGKKLVYVRIPWNKVSREIRVGSGMQDSINLTPLFKANSYFYGDKTPDGKHNIRDLVKFAIQALDTDNDFISNPNGSGMFMIFRAYLTRLSDNVNASWNEVKYAGRGDKFYIYDGFTRGINIGFKVAALSAQEMQPMYQKLNYLMSNLMPDYKNNVMRGPLVRMTVGNYIDGQLGILTSLTYDVPNDSPWEIAIDEPEGGTKLLILPHIIEVSLSFTPIGAETGGVNGNGKVIIDNKIAQKQQPGEAVSLLAQNTTGADVASLQYIERL